MVRKEREREITITQTRKQVEKECPTCHRLFWGAKISRYCSRTCRNKANYERHDEEYRKQRLESYYRQKKQSAKA